MKICYMWLQLLAFMAVTHGQDNRNAPFQFQVNARQIGVIIDPATNQVLGTGFIAGEHGHLITCWHVGSIGDAAAPKRYEAASADGKSSSFVSEIKPLHSDIGSDLESFQIVEPVESPALKLGEPKSIRPGDPIVYVGFRSSDRNLAVEQAIVSSTGSVINNGVVTEFLEFEGKGVPGFSGGPVFDRTGRVVALMREAWTKKGLRPGSPEILINRAYSIGPLKAME